jgi:hypothetical protein
VNILNHKEKVILPFLILAAFTLSSAVFALELDWPPSPTGKDLNDLTAGRELPEMIAYFYEWGISIGGLAAFFTLVVAGFQYLTSVGQPAKISDAKDKMISAVSGLLLLLASFIVLNVINPELTTLRIPGEINPPSDTLEPATTSIEIVLEPCEKAIAYSQTNYTGSSEEILPGAQKSLAWAEGAKSVQIIGSCRLEAYDAAGCPGDPMTILHSSYPDLSGLYLDPVRCVNNITESTGPPACENDCSMCTGQTACLASPAGCWWSTQWWQCLDSSEVTCDIDCSKCTKDMDCWLSIAGCKWEFGQCVPEHLE